MRITTNQVLRNYQSNLSKSNSELNSARNRVLTRRNFSKVSEDPASAATAYKLRKEYTDNANYLENVESTISHYDAVESSAMQMNEIAKGANALILEGITGTVGIEQRETIATSLRKMQESLVLSANSKLGEAFLFGGQATDKVPFKLEDGKLQYLNKNNEYTDISDPALQDELKAKASEEIMVDLGFGMTFDGGKIVTNSAFNTAFSGLTPLGFGQKNGMDTNIVNLLGEVADELEKESVDKEKLDALSKQFDESRNNLTDFITVLGTKSNFLNSTKERLNDNRITLNEKIVSVENVDLAESITDYSWAQFAYNAALKVGNSILSQSFIDFMR